MAGELRHYGAFVRSRPCAACGTPFMIEGHHALYGTTYSPDEPIPAKAIPNARKGASQTTPKGDAPAAPSMTTPVQAITWEKFARTMLPDARSMEVLVPRGAANFASITTAVHADAPPILQWDVPERRNPCNWYVWQHGSTAEQFGVVAGWAKVNGIALVPSMWNGGFPHQGKGAIVIIDKARDLRSPGLALFPEDLKSDLREIRATLEAHSKTAKMAGAEEASAAGLMFPEGQLRVTDRNGVVSTFRISSWD